MRQLQLKGYLLQQLKFLSGQDTVSMYKLGNIAKYNARLNDTLCMYLTLYISDKLRSKLVSKYSHIAQGCEALRGISETNLNSCLSSPYLSQYKTIYDNYLYSARGSHNYDAVKTTMHAKIVKVQKEKSISNYRIYTALCLNNGNTNAFLKNGDISKLSLDTARKILAYVNEY